jgi:hypothetical protein
MQNTVYQTETPRRVLWITHNTKHDVFEARYQPRNPKTGKPWQASRSISGRDVHVLFNGQDFIVRRGPAPWSGQAELAWTDGGRWKQGYEAFSSYEVALAALQKEIK